MEMTAVKPGAIKAVRGLHQMKSKYWPTLQAGIPVSSEQFSHNENGM
jgi:hypothetical protein